MKKYWLLSLLVIFFDAYVSSQQVTFSSLKNLVSGRGDTLTVLKVEKRSKNQIYLTGGGDYRIIAQNNSGLCRYLKSRCYAVQIVTALYVNCKKMRYKRFRFGSWFAPAIWIKNKIYFCAQPVGAVAASTATPTDETKLGGDVGTAIASSGLVNARVHYELDLSTGKVDFLGKDKMTQLLEGQTQLQDDFFKENCESADVVGKYLWRLKK